MTFDSNHFEFCSNIRLSKQMKNAITSRERNITAGNEIKCFENINDIPICSNMFNKPEKRPLQCNSN